MPIPAGKLWINPVLGDTNALTSRADMQWARQRALGAARGGLGVGLGGIVISRGGVSQGGPSTLPQNLLISDVTGVPGRPAS